FLRIELRQRRAEMPAAARRLVEADRRRGRFPGGPASLIRLKPTGGGWRTFENFPDLLLLFLPGGEGRSFPGQSQFVQPFCGSSHLADSVRQASEMVAYFVRQGERELQDLALAPGVAIVLLDVAAAV